MTFTLDAVDARHVGALIFLLEMATAYAGELYGIDAFDQPGVELGKQFTYGMLGRPGLRAGPGRLRAAPHGRPAAARVARAAQGWDRPPGG
jgi:glucose-6-phosphate isomerase